MPNKTIYVSDDDLALYDRAQELAGGNLSAAVAQGIRRFVRNQEGRQQGFQEVTVRVGEGRAMRTQRFSGELLGEWRHPGGGRNLELFQVWRTAKGHFALCIRRVPDWSAWADPSMWWGDWRQRAGTAGPRTRQDWRQELKQEMRREWGRGGHPHREEHSHGAEWCGGPRQSTLEVLDTLAELADKVPPEFYDTLVAAAEHPMVEDLDI